MKKIILIAFLFVIQYSYAQDNKWTFTLTPSVAYTSQNISGAFTTEPVNFSSSDEARSYSIAYNENYSYSNLKLDLNLLYKFKKWAVGLGVMIDQPLDGEDFIAENNDFSMNLLRGTNYSSSVIIKRNLNSWNVFARLGLNIYSGLSIEADQQKDGIIDWHDHNFGGLQAGIGVGRKLSSKFNLKAELMYNNFSMDQPFKDSATSREDLNDYSFSVGIEYSLF